ncbi:CBO0543 family protein [Neobacillus jeddahensis]|uniref:CBO0543 family protein n=1 Tax=Neobacillus jeddahensis TaxID=1461580 RepID=UPI00059159A6|nr:CBO0543 family protein [Neobacillus jeddahensis]
MEYKEHEKKLIDENVEQIHQLIMKKIEIWFDYVVFSDLWWFGVALSIIPWMIWFKFRKKESSDRILYGGFFVLIIALALDILGDQFSLWHYRFNVIPVVPTYFPWDITLMPVSVMILLQIKPDANPLVKAILFGIFSAYIAEPFFHWVGIYVPTKWKYTYSVPIQVAIYLYSHYLTRRKNFSPFFKWK